MNTCALVDGRKSKRDILCSFLKELDSNMQVVVMKNSEELFERLVTDSFTVLFIHTNTTKESGIEVLHHIKGEPDLNGRNMHFVIYGDRRTEVSVQAIGGIFISTDGRTDMFVDRFCATANAFLKDC
ncbi:MAG: hypothetical protein ACHQU0_01575 [Candidatus Paceibacteria bacterium]